MRKKRAVIWKRILAIALTVALLPVWGVQPVKAAGTVGSGNGTMVPIQADCRQADGPVLMNEVNNYRVGQTVGVVSGSAVTLNALEYDYNLENAAIVRATEFALINNAQRRPDGQDDVLSAYGGLAGAESTMSGSENAAAVCSRWRTQSADNANLVNPDYKYMGVGHVIYNGTHYWVAAFGDTKSSVPQLDLNGIQTFSVLYNGAMTKKLNTGLTPTLNLSVGDTKSFAGAKALATINGRDCPIAVTGTPSGTSSDSSVVSVEGTTIRALKTGTATVTVSLDTYTSTTTVTVQQAQITIDKIPDQNYTGAAITPAITVRQGNKTLQLNTDYTVQYLYNTNIGRATVQVIGRGTYEGINLTATFEIVTPTVANATVTQIPDQTFTGNPIYPNFTVYESGRVLQQGIDYNVTYTNNTNMGTATITITGIGTYRGIKTVTFKINGPSLYASTIDAIPDQLYTGSNIMPAVTVRMNNLVLIQNVDYSVSYNNNRNIGTATVTVTGRGNYNGSRTTTFRIIDRNLTYATVSSISNQRYTGSEIRPSVTVTLAGTVLREGVDYTLSYQNNRQPGTASVTITGAGSYRGSQTVTFKITQASLSSATVKAANQTYNGNEREPSVTVRLNGDLLEEGEDYELEYRNNTKPGKATVVVYGTGDYSGTKKATFIIKPKKQNLKSAKASGNSSKLVWTRDSNAKGYEIYRSKSKSSGYKRIGTFTTNKTTGCRNTNLARGTYYYKIRSYIVVDGKKYYGAFSNVKKVTIK